MTRQIFHPHATILALLLAFLVVTDDAGRTVVGTLLGVFIALVLSAIWEVRRHG